MINTILELEKYLETYSNLIFAGGTATPDTAIAKLETFHKLIGNPEQNLNIIHVAGTSGKGSFCTILAKGLNSQGFSTGHGLSPHLTNLNERFQLNSKPISDEKLIKYFNQIFPIIEGF
jgi:dihydrofolate synthase / folylpolyglutamate synthase